jgi:hypothetical protein
MESFLYQAGLIQQVPGAEVMIAMPPARITPQIANLVDVRAYNGWGTEEALLTLSFDAMAAEARAAGDTLWVYFNSQGACNAFEFSRATQGLYFWNSPFRAQHVWSYQFFRGDPFDDLDGPDMAYAYPDPARNFAPTLPTLMWEGYREGVDDVRYLYTLERALERGRNAALIAEVQGFLDSLRARLASAGPQARGIIAYFQPEDYQELRWQAAQYIVALVGAAAVPAPSPAPTLTPLPTPTALPAPRPTHAYAASPEPTEAAALAGSPTAPASPEPTVASASPEPRDRSCLPALGLFALPAFAAVWWVRVQRPGRPVAASVPLERERDPASSERSVNRSEQP